MVKSLSVKLNKYWPIIRAGILLLVFCVQSVAAYGAERSAERKIWNPPARFDHPYHGSILVNSLRQKKVVQECRRYSQIYGVPLDITPTQKGCAFHGDGWCHIIIIDRSYRGILPRDVNRHEIGHCNGWPSDHSM